MHDYIEYIKQPEELSVHAAQIGHDAGLRPGQPYPGADEARTIMANIISEGDDRLSLYDWNYHPKRVWDALTGKYFTVPAIGLGGGTILYNSQTQNK